MALNAFVDSCLPQSEEKLWDSNCELEALESGYCYC